jgi:hypothetical protein
MASQYTANRLLGGSLFFPLQLNFQGDRVTLIKPGIITRRERTIPLSMIASVSCNLGLITGTVIVESVGGGEDIIAPGFNREDIQRFCTEVEDAIS